MKLFVWDFHGTLEKGHEKTVVELMNAVLKENGHAAEADLVLLDNTYGRKWQKIFEELLPNETRETHLELEKKAVLFAHEHWDLVTQNIKPNDHSLDVLSKIAEHNDQILISAVGRDDLINFMKAVGVDSIFPEGKYFAVYDTDREPTSKQQILENYLIGKQYEKIINIGDSPGDMIPVANSTHYLYVHAGRTFRECNPDYRINDLREVLKEI
jgi:phosphoglycolate phosphatase-like HAD superfamily hydrolase